MSVQKFHLKTHPIVVEIQYFSLDQSDRPTDLVNHSHTASVAKNPRGKLDPYMAGKIILKVVITTMLYLYSD